MDKSPSQSANAVRLIFLGFDSSTVQSLQSLAKDLKAKADPYKFALPPDTTHVVVPAKSQIDCKHECILSAIAMEIWIVNDRFVTDSAKAKKWLSETRYLDRNAKLTTYRINNGHIGNSSVKKTERGQFRDWKVLIFGYCTESKLRLERILLAGLASFRRCSPETLQCRKTKCSCSVTHIFLDGYSLPDALVAHLRDVHNVVIQPFAYVESFLYYGAGTSTRKRLSPTLQIQNSEKKPRLKQCDISTSGSSGFVNDATPKQTLASRKPRQKCESQAVQRDIGCQLEARKLFSSLPDNLVLLKHNLWLNLFGRQYESIYATGDANSKERCYRFLDSSTTLLLASAKCQNTNTLLAFLQNLRLRITVAEYPLVETTLKLVQLLQNASEEQFSLAVIYELAMLLTDLLHLYPPRESNSRDYWRTVLEHCLCSIETTDRLLVHEGLTRTINNIMSRYGKVKTIDDGGVATVLLLKFLVEIFQLDFFFKMRGTSDAAKTVSSVGKESPFIADICFPYATKRWGSLQSNFLELLTKFVTCCKQHPDIIDCGIELMAMVVELMLISDGSPNSKTQNSSRSGVGTRATSTLPVRDLCEVIVSLEPFSTAMIEELTGCHSV